MPQADPNSVAPDGATGRAAHPGRPSHEGARARRSSTARSRERATGTESRPHAVVPASVWPPETPVDPDAAWPEPILDRIVTTLSAPGQAVALLTDQPATDPPGPGYGTAARAIVPPGTLAAARERIEAHDRRSRIAHWQPETSGAAEPFWSRFVHPSPETTGTGHGNDHDSQPYPRPAHAALRRPAESAALVVAAVNPTGVGDDFGVAAAQLLRDGGTLAVITHCDCQRGQLIDPSGSIVASAQNADLIYLQHIVALHHPIASGHLTRSHRGAAGTSKRHRRVHSDVYLFAWHQTAAALSQARAA